ncbi:enoyl-CoA hydratase/isomerase family protein [Desulfitobacterium chlororespirans]|uniref:Enoyl-CoA hydratase/carnithine racemase n=1 Tax=Desulfitobacterium chlororespirans DSM 11544 TaxID=1121395 RepID=A0A1M7UGF2_9FIRM|nr:enoyl-CoA hydratase-related protein [Desulfitobacterium chlororespirans]SHN81957.1 Enoyl-CoA hydratase/carnithine racemase [Desulfitobacterium chlororespirans DSM 11544]
MSGIELKIENYIATVTVNRPPANALNKETYIAIRDTFYSLEERDDVKVVVLTGAGKIFMAGNEFDEFPEMMERKACTTYYDIIRNGYLSVKNCKYPVIGAINGAAVGSGCAFAGCCDLLVAVEGAKFALSEIKVGIIGADGFASLMVPEKVLRYMALSGNPLTAEEIYRHGGIHQVVPKGELMNAAYKLANELAQNARRALIQWKLCLNQNYEHDLPKKFNNNLNATVAYHPYHDFKEASSAFIAKRPPEFDNK